MDLYKLGDGGLVLKATSEYSDHGAAPVVTVNLALRLAQQAQRRARTLEGFLYFFKVRAASDEHDRLVAGLERDTRALFRALGMVELLLLGRDGRSVLDDQASTALLGLLILELEGLIQDVLGPADRRLGPVPEAEREGYEQDRRLLEGIS